MSRHILFVATLWIALTVALLCALLPTGLPRSTSVGSAFSPSTTIVALGGSTEQGRGAFKRVIKGNPKPLPDVLLSMDQPFFVTVEAAAFILIRFLGNGPSDAAASAPPLPDIIIRHPLARGPPST